MRSTGSETAATGPDAVDAAVLRVLDAVGVADRPVVVLSDTADAHFGGILDKAGRAVSDLDPRPPGAALAVLRAAGDVASLDAAARDAVARYGALPIIVVAPTHDELAGEASTVTARLDLRRGARHFDMDLTPALEPIGFVQLFADDVPAADEPDLDTASGRNLRLFAEHLRAFGHHGFVGTYVRAYVQLQQRHETPQRAGGRPFLTALVRTLGDRNDMLMDALASLAGQTDRDLQVLVLVHTADPAAVASVESMVSAFDPAFAEQVEVVVVEGGGRSRPLNVGLGLARGEYVSFLDDDDVVFCHWVAEFRAGAQRAPGSVVRASCSDQSFTRHDSPHTPFEPTSGTTLPRDETFDPLTHFHHNESPICSIALPVDVLRAHELSFDESLPVVEDWDLLLRTMVVAGVTSRSEPTSIYRRWPTDNSASAHSEQLWRTARDFVLVKLDQHPLLLPPGSASRIAEAYEVPLGGGPQYETTVARAADLARELDASEIRLADAELRYKLISESEWWRATRPMRSVGVLVKRLVRRLTAR